MARAFRFTPTREAPNDYWTYRRDIGLWVETAQRDHLMITSMVEPRPPQPRPPHPRPEPERPPMSKKADMETGEDMKGE